MHRLRPRALVVGVLVGCLALAPVGHQPVGAEAEPEPRATTSFRVRGAGNGHGVGMSQYGALHRAEAGQSVEEILGFYYPGTTVGPDSGAVNHLRVRVATSVRTVRVTPVSRLSIVRNGTRLGTVRRPVIIRSRNGVLSVNTAGGRVICTDLDASNPCGDHLRLRHPQGDAVTVTTAGATVAYRWGAIIIGRVDGLPRLQVVIGRLPLERYLLGLAEVPASWPAATLQAQAIAGRSFASVTTRIRRSSSGWLVPWDLESGQSDQVYNGSTIELASYGRPWLDAVAATTGLVVRGADGRSLTTNYSASNGGYMESGAYVFGSANPWLIAAPDPFDIPSPFDAWKRTYTSAELRRWLVAAGYADPGAISRVRVGAGRGESGRIDQARVVVRGRRATVRLSGRAFFNAVNLGLLAEGDTTRKLLSTKLSIRKATS